MIVVHLVIIGKNPLKNEYSLGLLRDLENKKVKTVQQVFKDDSPESIACNLATDSIKAPLDWYSVRKHNFVYINGNLHLIYIATIPENIKLNNVEWFSIRELDEKNIDEVERDIIIEGIKI